MARPDGSRPDWSRILAPVALAIGGALGGGVGSFSAAADSSEDVRELRADVRELTRDVAQLRAVVDALAVAVVRKVDGDAAARHAGSLATDP